MQNKLFALLIQSGSQEGVTGSTEEHHAMGYTLRKQGDFQGAILRYSRALEGQPGHFSALFNRGFCHDKVARCMLIEDWVSWKACDMHTGSRTFASGGPHGDRSLACYRDIPACNTGLTRAERATERQTGLSASVL